MADVFLSYSRSDRPFAERTATVLGEAGIRCFLDIALLSPGADWSRAIEDAIEGCSAVVLIASRDSLASPSCAYEWRRAALAGKPVVLAGIEPIAVPDELARQPSVDMRAGGAAAWRRLADAVHGSRAQAGSLASLRVPGPMLAGAASLALLRSVVMGWSLEAIVAGDRGGASGGALRAPRSTSRGA
jgi:hypothetical protein